MSNFEFLIYKDVTKEHSSKEILTPVDRLIEGLKIFQSLYPYFLHIVSHPLFTEFYDAFSGIPYFKNCQTSLQHTFSDNFAMTRCTATRMVNNFFFFPHNTLEDVLNPLPFQRKKSFSDISELVGTEYENITVKRYNMYGSVMPDHTFLTVEFGQYLIIIQSFYYAYNMNSKYGVILLSGDEITTFKELMQMYETKVNEYNQQKILQFISNVDIDDMIILDSNFNRDIQGLNILFQRYTGIDNNKHCPYVINLGKNPIPIMDVLEVVYSKEKFLENLCQKLSNVLRFLVSSTDFESIKEDDDIFMVYEHSGPSQNIYTLYNSFIDNVDFSRVNPKFIEYTGFTSALDIDKQNLYEGECEQKNNNVYNILTKDVLNINILFTGINYIFDLFNCTGIFVLKYGDTLDTYTGDSWSREFYKKILSTSKLIRDIYTSNPDKNLDEIVNLAEKRIKMVGADHTKYLFVPVAPVIIFNPVSLPSLEPLSLPPPIWEKSKQSSSAWGDNSDSEPDFSKELKFPPLFK